LEVVVLDSVVDLGDDIKPPLPPSKGGVVETSQCMRLALLVFSSRDRRSERFHPIRTLKLASSGLSETRFIRAFSRSLVPVHGPLDDVPDISQ
jgi:hypothetical protein